MEYYSNPRNDVLQYFIDNIHMLEVDKNILELGGGNGAFAENYWKRFLPESYTLVDLEARSNGDCGIQKKRCDAIEFVHQLGDSECFDIIIMNDFFEHIIPDDKFMWKIGKLLSPTGTIFLSLPNIGNLGSILNLLKGDFEYTDKGVLDRTHVRFYTPKSVVRFYDSFDFRSVNLVPQSKYAAGYPILKRAVSSLLSSFDIFWFEHQFFCVFEKK